MTTVPPEEIILGDSGDPDPYQSDSSPKTNLPFFQPKKIKPDIKDTPHQHPYGTRSKTQTNTTFQAPNVGEGSDADTGFGSLVSSIFVPWAVTQLKTVTESSFTLCTKSFHKFFCFPTCTIVVGLCIVMAS